MAESHVVSGLISKRSELAGLVQHHHKEIDRLAQEIATLDAAIKMFSPGYRIESIKPKRYQEKNSFFKHGEASRMIFDILRELDRPVRTNDITKAIMSSKGIGAECEKPLQATILTALHSQKKKGLVDFTGRDRAGCCLWQLI